MIPDHLLFSTGNACKQCGSENLLPGRRICRICYNQKCKEHRQEFPVSAEYWQEYREKNRAKLTKYNREYMRKRRAKQ